MKRRFTMGRGLVAAALLTAGGGALAAWSAIPAGAAGTAPQISTLAHHGGGGGAPTVGHPKVAATATLSPGFVAYDSANGDKAVLVNSTGAAHVYLIAGANEANEYHIATAVGVYGTLIAGDAYLVAGTNGGTIGMISDPGAPTAATGGSTSAGSTTNAIDPVSLAFDTNGNLLIGEFMHNTSTTESGIQAVAKSAGTSYGFTVTAGQLVSVSGTGAWKGITRSGHSIVTTGVVYPFAVSVDSGGNLLVGSSGEVYFYNETGTAISRYGQSLPSHLASIVTGTATHGAATCPSGGTTVAATGSASPKYQWPHPYVDASGNVFVNDDKVTANKGCTWELKPTGAHVTSLTGGATATAYSSGAVANTVAFPGTQEVTEDAAGNVLLAVNGTTPALLVIAESTGTYYNQHMTKGDVYQISGGARTTATPTTAAGFKLTGAARSNTLPEYGITSLGNGASGDLLLTDGSNGAGGFLYQITKAPTGPPAPTVTSVTPSSGGIHGGTAVTVHGSNLTGISKVKFGGLTATTVHGVGATSATAKTPAHGAGAVTVSVTATLGTGSKATAFTYTGPAATSTHLTVSGTHYKGTHLTLTATVSPNTVAGTVKIQELDPATVCTKPVTHGAVTCTYTIPVTGPQAFKATFTPATATAFAGSTSGTPTTGTATGRAFTATTKPTTGGTVRQPFQLTVKAGRLTLSCTRYATVETPPTITTPALGAAIKTCPIVILPKVQLNGVTQTRTSVMNPIYVYTARGTATAGWALSAAMVPTVNNPTDSTLLATPTTAPHVAGTPAHEPITVSASCATAADFCDETGTLGATARHGQIPATDFSLNKAYTCTPAATNHNPTPAPQTTGAFGTAYTTAHGTFTSRTLALCTAAAGTSGGKFEVSGGKFTLTVPSIIRHGKYFGTVEYSLVSH